MTTLPQNSKITTPAAPAPERGPPTFAPVPPKFLSAHAPANGGATAAPANAEADIELLVQKMLATPEQRAAALRAGMFIASPDLDKLAEQLKRGGPESKAAGLALAKLLRGEQLAQQIDAAGFVLDLAARLATAFPKGNPTSMVQSLQTGLSASGLDGEKVGERIAAEQAHAIQRAERRTAQRRDKRTFNVDELEQDDLIGSVIEAIAGDDSLYQRVGSAHLVHVTREAVAVADAKLGKVFRPAGAPTIRTLAAPTVTEVINRRCAFLSNVDSDLGGLGVKPCGAPGWLTSTIMARGQWSHIRPLRGVVDYPVLKPDGTVLSKAGFDADTLYLSDNKIQILSYDPTRENALQAVVWFRELLSNFPFENRELGLACWISGLLSLLARPAFEGPVPMLLIDANESGSGKSLLAKMLGLIVFGAEPPMRSIPTTEEEWKKSLFAIASAGDNLIVLDNVTGVLRSASLDVALTSSRVADRVLGATEDRKVDLRAMFVATMNNGSISRDLVRRSIHCRLVCDAERPEHRQDFRIPDIEAHVLHNRAALLSAAFTILRAYRAAGVPAVRMQHFGGFERWSKVVRAPLAWLDLPDVAASQEALRESSDVETTDLSEFLQSWFEHFGTREITADGLKQAPMNLQDQVRGMTGVKSGEALTASKVGYLLRKHRSRRAGEYRLTQTRKNDRKVALWQVTKVG